MAPTTILKAIAAIKDQTSISLAKLTGNVAADFEFLVVSATSHHDEPCAEQYLKEIARRTLQSRGHVNAFVFAISKRLSKTRDWIVAVNTLILVHVALIDGDPFIAHEFLRRGSSRIDARVLNMSDFRDAAHSNSSDQSAFVRGYSLYLEQKMKFTVYEMKLQLKLKAKAPNNGRGQMKGLTIPPFSSVREMNLKRILKRLNHLLKLIDRLPFCIPLESATTSRMVLTALHPLVKESFSLNLDLCEVLEVLETRFPEMTHSDSQIAFPQYLKSATTINELQTFHHICEDLRIFQPCYYPEMKKITSDLETLRGHANAPKVLLQEPVPGKHEHTNEIKSPPAPQNIAIPQTPPLPQPPVVQPEVDLVNLRETSSEHSNKLELALFSETVTFKEGSWETFTSEERPELVKADWELALVESLSNLSTQKHEMGGGFDPLILNGMYDQQTLPGTDSTRVLALPAPDGTIQSIRQEDPFQASLSIPPPAYVQLADMEKKQHLLAQQQQLWQQYGSNEMQGQVGFDLYGPISQSYYAPPPF